MKPERGQSKHFKTMMDDLWDLFAVCGFWLENKGKSDYIAVQMPLDGEIEIEFIGHLNYYKSSIRNRNVEFIRRTVATYGSQIYMGKKGEVIWHNRTAEKLVYIIEIIHEAEIGLRNQAQANTLFYMAVLRKWDLQKPVFQRLSKDITQLMGIIFYQEAKKGAREFEEAK